MKANLLSIDGKKSGEIELPHVFTEEYRPDLIKRAFLAETSSLFQPKGINALSGLRGTPESWDVGGGRSRIPRTKAGPHRGGRERGHRYRSKGRWFPAAGRAAGVPGVVGGRQAHPPKPEKVLLKNINKKEKGKAMASAIAATSAKNLAELRGHALGGIENLPIVVEDKLGALNKTSDVVKALGSIGISADLERARAISGRAGKGRARGRGYRKRKSALIVLPSSSLKNMKRFENIPGIDVAISRTLSISLLAPGAKAGRLTIWTKSSLEELKKRFGQK